MDSIELLRKAEKGKVVTTSDLQKNEDAFCLRLWYYRWTTLIRPKVTVTLYNTTHESHKVDELILNYKTENYGAEISASFVDGVSVVSLKHFFLFKLLLSAPQVFSMTAIQEPVAVMKLEATDDIAVAFVNGLYPTLIGAIFGGIAIILACFVNVSLGMIVPILVFGCKVLCDAYILHELLCNCPMNALFSVDSTVTYELKKFRSTDKTNILDNIVYRV
jgi:hypothetical protein